MRAMSHIVVALCVVGLLCVATADAAATRSALRSRLSLPPAGRFPVRDPVSEPLFDVRAPETMEKTFNTLPRYRPIRPKILNKQCPSINDLVCSGHGNCSRSSAHVFGVADINVVDFVCSCQPGWDGSGCHKNVSLLPASQLDAAKEMFNNPNRTSSLIYQDVKGATETMDPGSIFGRMAFKKARVPFSWIPGRIRYRYEPARSSLDAWVSPPESTLATGARLLATWERARMEIQIVPVSASRVKKYATPRGTMALYTSDKGQSIVAPTIYEGQEGMPLADPSKPLATVTRDPTSQKFLQTLNQKVNATAVKKA